MITIKQCWLNDTEGYATGLKIIVVRGDSSNIHHDTVLSLDGI